MYTKGKGKCGGGKRWVILLTIALVPLFILPGSVRGDDLGVLEKRVEALEKKDRKNKKPSFLSGVKLGGYGEFEYEDTEGKSSTFDNHRLVLKVTSALTKWMRFNSEIEYEHGTKEIELEQAYMDIIFHRWVNIRVGAVLVPVGRLNLYHDAPLLEPTSRPMVDRFIIPSTWTEVGAGLFGGGIVTGPIYGGYEFYGINGLTESITGTKGLRDARGDLEQDNNSNKAFTGRVFARYGSLFEIGVSGYTGKADKGNSSRVSIFAFDGLVKYSPFELAGEYGKVNITRGSLSVPAGMDGFYIEGRAHLLPPSMNVPSWATKFTVFYRYGDVDLDRDMVDENDRTRHTLGLNYRPIPTMAVKGEYQFNREEGSSADNDTILLSLAFYF